MTNPRLLLIGLDAADKDLIDQWAAEGLMPAFAKLMNTSTWGDTENPRGLEAGSCWPAFYSGCLPSVTGQYDGARRFDPLTYRDVYYRPDSSSRDAIWTVLSKQDVLCGVIDAPYNYPMDEVNGMKVNDRGSHVPAGGSDYMEFKTFPPELADEIIRRFGPDPANGHSSDFFDLSTAAGVKEFRDIYVQRIENKADLTLHYWNQRPWSFFMSVFTEAHCVGHRCWHIHDPDHPNHDPAIAAAVGDPLKDIYIALDRAVGRMVEEGKKDAEVLVFTSHGMGPGYSGTRLLDRILVRLEDGEEITRSDPVTQFMRAGWRAMPDFVRRPLKPLRNKVSNDNFQPNRKGRRFFEVIANDRTGGVRINLKGRDANGIVEPGEEYDTLCRELMADLREVKNAVSGEPLAEEVILVRDHYEGPNLDALPDILMTWNRSHSIDVATSPKIGTVDKTGLCITRSGDHRPVGRFYAVSPDLPFQRLNDKVKVQDFAPTIAAMFGVGMDSVNGSPIEALLKREPRRAASGQND